MDMSEYKTMENSVMEVVRTFKNNISIVEIMTTISDKTNYN